MMNSNLTLVFIIYMTFFFGTYPKVLKRRGKKKRHLLEKIFTYFSIEIKKFVSRRGLGGHLLHIPVPK